MNGRKNAGKRNKKQRKYVQKLGINCFKTKGSGGID